MRTCGAAPGVVEDAIRRNLMGHDPFQAKQEGAVRNAVGGSSNARWRARALSTTCRPLRSKGNLSFFSPVSRDLGPKPRTNTGGPANNTAAAGRADVAPPRTRRREISPPACFGRWTEASLSDSPPPFPSGSRTRPRFGWSDRKGEGESRQVGQVEVLHQNRSGT